MTDADRLWTVCAGALRDQVSDSTWKGFFQGIWPVSLTADRLVLAVPNALVKERLEGRYLGHLRDVVAGIAGGGVEVAIEVHTDPADDLDDPAGLDDDDPPPSRAWQAPTRPAGRSAPLVHPKYTFETFVIGASNRFAHAAALAVAERPAKSYNPLVIHGEAGLGKTHLLHAVGHYIREHNPELSVRSVTTETFMNEFIDAIRTNNATSFKRQYRAWDVLLVDDIQFLENREGTQEAFFHTFNGITAAGGQIVLTSDCHPKALVTLEERLRSRFMCGLITDVQPPDLETRLAILRRKADADGTPIPDDVLEFIAVNVKNNIRVLEGALVRVSARVSLTGEPATLALAEQQLADIVAGDQPRPITPQLILETTAETFGFGVDELCGASRRRPLVTARQIGMYVFRELTDFSFPAIGRQFGDRDHTTVMHAVEKITALMKERRQIYDQVNELMLRIKKGG